MGESRGRTGFGQIDLQVPEEPGIEEESSDAFGELDWDLPESAPPPPPTNQSSRLTVRRDEAEIEAVLDEEREKTPPPSESGVEATGDRVALMREAYARGDADGALTIAAAIQGATMPPPAGGFDHPDAAVDVEIGGEVEIEVDAEDPVYEKDLTRVVPSASPPRAVPSPALPSLTERHGVPRIVMAQDEIAKLPIDHRAGFLLGAMDGMHTMEEILDVCPMPPSEALELIRALLDMRVITIE